MPPPPQAEKRLTYAEFAALATKCVGDDHCMGRPPKSVPEGLHGRTNPHWRPQLFVTHLFKFLPAFNFVGSFEHLEAHTRALLQVWSPSYGWSG